MSVYTMIGPAPAAPTPPPTTASPTTKATPPTPPTTASPTTEATPTMSPATASATTKPIPTAPPTAAPTAAGSSPFSFSSSAPVTRAAKHRHLGCFADHDGRDGRMLRGGSTSSVFMTPAMCSAFCAARESSVFNLQYGTE